MDNSKTIFLAKKQQDKCFNKGIQVDWVKCNYTIYHVQHLFDDKARP